MADKKAKVEELLQGGSILKSFGSKYFVSITLAPDICKAKVEMVEIGNGGKNANCIYLDIEDLRQLFVELDSGIFAKKIQADKKNQYPQAYQFVKGEDGSKKVNIGASQKQGHIAFQTQVKKGEKWDNRIMAVSTAELKQAGFLFSLVLGLIQVAPNSYYDGLKKTFEKGLEEKQKYFNKDTSNQPEEPEPEPSKDSYYELTTTGKSTENGDFIIFPVKAKNGSNFKLMVRKSEEQSKKMKTSAEKENLIFLVYCERKGDYLLYKSGIFQSEKGA